MAQTIFIAGITGCQGGAVARQALKKGWTIHGLARSPDSPAAISLAALGIKIFAGDYDNAAALGQAIAGCTAVFLVPSPSFTDLTAELRWAKAILSTAKASSTVKTAVVSTSLGTESLGLTETPTLFSQFMLSKKNIEVAVAESGLDSWTVIRPGFFMANFLIPKVAMYQGFRDTGIWTSGLKPTTRLPLVDDYDIGAFAVAAVEDPATFHGKKIEVASDVKTPLDIVKVLSDATGRKLEAAFMSDEEMEAERMANPMIAGYFAMRTMIDMIDIDEAKSYGMPMSTFDEYVQRNIGDVKKTFVE